MNIEVLNRDRVAKLIVATLIAVVLVMGCKGKEEKQTPSSLPSTERQERVCPVCFIRNYN